VAARHQHEQGRELHGLTVLRVELGHTGNQRMCLHVMYRHDGLVVGCSEGQGMLDAHLCTQAQQSTRWERGEWCMSNHDSVQAQRTGLLKMAARVRVCFAPTFFNITQRFTNLLVQLSIFLIDLFVGTYRLSSHARLEAFVFQTKLNITPTCMQQSAKHSDELDDLYATEGHGQSLFYKSSHANREQVEDTRAQLWCE